MPPEDRADAVVVGELMVCFNGVMRGAVVEDPDPNWVVVDDPVRRSLFVHQRHVHPRARCSMPILSEPS